MQHLNHSRTQNINSQVRREHTTTVSNRREACNTLQNHQVTDKTFHNHAKVAITILKRQDSVSTGHNHHAASKS